MIDVIFMPDRLPFGFLLADMQDIIALLIPFAAVLFWILNQVFGGEQKKPANRRAPRPAQPRPQKPVAQARPARPAAAAEVNEEVADFLRRAAQKRGGQPAAEVEVIRPERARRPRPQPRPNEPVIATAEMVDEPRVARQQPASRRPAVAHAASSDAVDQADERMDQHLHDVFDHQLGRLGSMKPAAAPKRAPAKVTSDEIASSQLSAAGFAALLASAQGARQAILVSEILQRPEDRW